MTEILVRLRGLKVHFPVKKGIIFTKQTGIVKAVDGLDLDIRVGETLGLVGESGCGKSTTGRAVVMLRRPTAGSVIYRGVPLTSLSPQKLLPYRRKLQIIFQDPYASLNPRMTVGAIIGEPILEHTRWSAKKRQARVSELMDLVGLDPDFARRYPHEFSGGQRQRIGIARALALNPEFLVCDEPVSALDVSIQAQVINLLQDLQKELGLTYLFIAHDLAAVRHLSDRIAVMYLGKLVELGTAEQVVKDPLHPYSKALVSAVPIPDPDVESKRKRVILSGDVPSPLDPPAGCHFHTRCPVAEDLCKRVMPVLADVGNDRMVACHLVKQDPAPS
ncbi:MAG: oligopeptide transport system ATP-binding protein [Myxococcota bacterium]|jgi:oligopeptide transport system ATP-binding protein